jgi:hypothetical protein
MDLSNREMQRTEQYFRFLAGLLRGNPFCSQFLITARLIVAPVKPVHYPARVGNKPGNYHTLPEQPPDDKFVQVITGSVQKQNS